MNSQDITQRDPTQQSYRRDVEMDARSETQRPQALRSLAAKFSRGRFQNQIFAIFRIFCATMKSP